MKRKQYSSHRILSSPDRWQHHFQLSREITIRFQWFIKLGHFNSSESIDHLIIPSECTNNNKPLLNSNVKICHHVSLSNVVYFGHPSSLPLQIMIAINEECCLLSTEWECRWRYSRNNPVVFCMNLQQLSKRPSELHNQSGAAPKNE